MDLKLITNKPLIDGVRRIEIIFKKLQMNHYPPDIRKDITYLLGGTMADIKIIEAIVSAVGPQKIKKSIRRTDELPKKEKTDLLRCVDAVERALKDRAKG